MLEYPAHWRLGELLAVQRYTDGSFKVTLLADQDKRECLDDASKHVYFDNSVDAQNFISYWYAPH